jgi:hypothetical protein
MSCSAAAPWPIPSSPNASAAKRAEQPDEYRLAPLQPLIADYWSQVLEKLEPRHAPGRLKQWLGLLRRHQYGGLTTTNVDPPWYTYQTSPHF